VGVIEVGIRELQRETTYVMERVEADGHRLIVCRHGRPIAVLVPIAQARAWALLAQADPG
jgi:prevent-host-death family protein